MNDGLIALNKAYASPLSLTRRIGTLVSTIVSRKCCQQPKLPFPFSWQRTALLMQWLNPNSKTNNIIYFSTFLPFSCLLSSFFFLHHIETSPLQNNIIVSQLLCSSFEGWPLWQEKETDLIIQDNDYRYLKYLFI